MKSFLGNFYRHLPIFFLVTLDSQMTFADFFLVTLDSQMTFGDFFWSHWTHKLHVAIFSGHTGLTNDITYVLLQEVLEQSKNTIHFIRLHAPWPLLCRYAEELNLRAPIQVSCCVRRSTRKTFPASPSPLSSLQHTVDSKQMFNL